MQEKILDIINTLKPYFNMDGGDLEFIKYEEGYVYVKLLGNCSQCDYLDNTIQDVVYSALKSEIPEIEGVIPVDF